MTGQDATEERIRRILSVVLKRPIAPGEPVSRETEPRWDSLRHVELIFSVEDEFSVTFDEDELPRLTSLRAIADAVARREAGVPSGNDA